MNIEQSDRITELEQALADSRRELDEFLYTISHDLRSPLRAILTSCMILSEDFGDKLDAEGREELKRQATAARKINSILEEVLKLSRLARQTMTLERLDLAALARAVVERRGLVPEQALAVPDEMFCTGDKRLTLQLLELLVDNSLKFASQDRPLLLELIERDGSFSFSDNGIGIQPDQAEKIFIPFEKLHGDRFPGMGMGLTTSKRIVQRHGGQIGAEPLETGLRVCFSLAKHRES